MALEVTPTALGETVVAGDDYTATITITKDGATYDVTGATVTASLRPKGGRHNALLDHAVTLSDATNGIVTIAWTDTETASLLWADYAANYLLIHDFLLDFKVVESGGDILHSPPVNVPVRRGIT